MRTRLIVVAVVGGLVLLVGPQYAGHGSPPSPAAPDSAAAEIADPVVPARIVSVPTTGVTPSVPSTTRSVPSTAPSPTRPVDRAETDFPVVGFLPHAEAGWAVDWRMEGPTLVLRVTVSAIVNRADQAAERRAQLTANKAAALAWLAAHGAPVGTYGVVWTPSEVAWL